MSTIKKYTINVLRRESADSSPYRQSFAFEGDPNLTVSDMLDRLNFSDDLYDIYGNAAPRIAWDCSCQQGVCGACAMVICGIPALACKTKLSDCRRVVITLEPLSKFPVVRDLCVDRSSLWEFPIARSMWLTGDAVYNKKLLQFQYAAAKCLKCGLCVEVCPNTGIAGTDSGAYFAAECFLKETLGGDSSVKKQAKREFMRSFAADCSKSLSCAEVCPAGIDFKKIICMMNSTGNL